MIEYILSPFSVMTIHHSTPNKSSSNLGNVVIVQILCMLRYQKIAAVSYLFVRTQIAFLQGCSPTPMLNGFSMSEYNFLKQLYTCLTSQVQHTTKYPSTFELTGTTWVRRAAAPLHASRYIFFDTFQ